MGKDAIKGALRALLLPIRPDSEPEAVDAAVQALGKCRIAEEDIAAFLPLQYQRWREGETPGKPFREAVEAYLEAGEPMFGKPLAGAYFHMHEKLSRLAQFDHNLAGALLSHARLIVALAVEDRLSSAQIGQLLSRRDPRLPVSWVAVDVVLRTLKHQPKLDLNEVESLYALDRENEESAFGDAALSECVQLIGRIAADLGLALSFERSLSVLTTDPFAPHLKMLHFLCVIAEYYDHPLQFPYEFSPRGAVSNWLAQQYPSALGNTGNPFLNNAKSVDVLDRGWANSKKTAQSQHAHALVTAVESLSSLGFSARRELATWVRRLLARVIRQNAGRSATALPAFGPREIKKLLDAVSAGPTATLGVVEQRIVDAVGFLRHPFPDWVGRGLGDSVNATNISRRKCGDCDFQDAVKHRVVAFEPHAGRLTNVYTEAHQLTLEKVLTYRMDEWADTVGLGGKWSVTVMFVTHEMPDGELRKEVALPGVTAEISAVTFEDFLADVDPDDRHTQFAFRELVHQQLMADRTPDAVRQRVAAIIS